MLTIAKGLGKHDTKACILVHHVKVTLDTLYSAGILATIEMTLMPQKKFEIQGRGKLVHFAILWLSVG